MSAGLSSLSSPGPSRFSVTGTSGLSASGPMDCAMLVLLAYPHQRLQDHVPQYGGTSETDRMERKKRSGRPTLVECVESP